LSAKLSVAVSLLMSGLTAAALAQSNIGELLDKGGKKVIKADFDALLPLRVKYKWPQGGGDGDLVYAADGTLQGTESHWRSRSDSPTTGTWTFDDNGRWCIKKSLIAWNTTTDLCWYLFQAGDRYFMSQADIDRSARIAPIESIAKVE
jgi:hypothetical protein